MRVQGRRAGAYTAQISEQQIHTQSLKVKEYWTTKKAHKCGFRVVLRNPSANRRIYNSNISLDRLIKLTSDIHDGMFLYLSPSTIQFLGLIRRFFSLSFCNTFRRFFLSILFRRELQSPRVPQGTLILSVHFNCHIFPSQRRFKFSWETFLGAKRGSKSCPYSESAALVSDLFSGIESC